MKKILALLLVLVMLFAFAACGSDEETQPTNDPEPTDASEGEEYVFTELTDEDWAKIAEDYPADIKYDTEHEVGYQLEMPEAGDQIAIIHTTMGDITIRLFPENAPNTVENFIGLAERGDYENVPFHRVINNFMIQTGDTTAGNGTGGTSFSGDILYDEFCDKLFNIRGSVAMANSGRDTNGSQFFINQTPASETSSWDMLESQWEYFYEGIGTYYGTDSFIAFAAYYGGSCFNPNLMSDEVKALYDENGGNPHLDGCFNVFDRGHTVFGQVIDGMDVVDAIAAVETDDSDAPLESILIESIEITTYE